MAGVLAGALVLGVAHLVAALTVPAASPVLAVGATAVDLTPGWLKDLAIAWFGTRDKLALGVGMAVVLTAVTALTGILAARRKAAGAAAVIGLGAVAGAAALTRPGATALWAVPVVSGTTLGLLALLLMIDAVSKASRPVPGGASRRAVLVGAAVAVASVTAGAAGRLAQLAPSGRTPKDLTLPAPTQPAAALGPDAELVDAPSGLTAFRTPNADFYRIDTALSVPRVDTDTWRLRVHGLVERPVEFSLDDLLAAGLVERWVTLTCVSNEVGGSLAGNALWLGVPVRRLLEQARPTDDADMVLSRSVDGWTASTPLSAFTDGRDALVAVGMNGEPLPYEHGFPARLVVPGLYGYVSATKWLTELELTRFDRDTAYWTDRGWAEQAPIRTASRIDVPASFARIAAGPTAVAGVAWAQHRGLQQVEVRVDRGPWQQARLADGAGIDTWAQWVWTWDAEPGDHTLEVRATDRTGAAQPQERRPPKPDGATGWHAVVVRVD